MVRCSISQTAVFTCKVYILVSLSVCACNLRILHAHHAHSHITIIRTYLNAAQHTQQRAMTILKRSIQVNTLQCCIQNTQFWLHSTLMTMTRDEVANCLTCDDNQYSFLSLENSCRVTTKQKQNKTGWMNTNNNKIQFCFIFEQFLHLFSTRTFYIHLNEE